MRWRAGRRPAPAKGGSRADGADEPIRAAIAAVVAALPEVVDGVQSTKATVEGRALDTLDTVLQWELDNARLSKLGSVFGPR